MPGKNRSFWFSSLAVRLALIWSLVIAVAVAVTGLLINQDNKEHLVETLRGNVQQDAKAIQVKLETWTNSFLEDARFCAQSPLLKKFMGHLGTEEETVWRQLLEDEFRAMLIGKPAYFQMRVLLVGGDDEGLEILRLDHNDGEIVSMPTGQLQNKAGRTYFKEARDIPPGEIYLSQLDLNRDFGQVSEPRIPTLRAATHFVGESNEALVIINANLSSLFEEVQAMLSGADEVRLAGPSGDFLIHPDSGATFARDTGGSVFLETEYPGASRFFSNGADGDWLEGVGGNSIARDLVFAKTVTLGWPERTLLIITSLPHEEFLGEIFKSGKRILTVTFLAAIAAALAALLVAAPLVKRLKALTEALKGYRMGNELAGLPSEGEDEVGVAVSHLKEMAERVSSHVDKIENAHREAEQATRAKEEFLAVMSHGIRTPMNAVVGLIAALESNKPSPQQEPVIRSMRTAAENLMALLNTALDYTKLQAGHLEFAKVDFDVVELVKEVGQAYQPSVMAKGLALEVVAAEQRLAVRGDPVRLRQILNNLVGNAVKFTRQGRIGILLEATGHRVSLSVQDTGPGIAESERETVFQKFEQATAASRKGEMGVGLGLAIARELVERQGGSLTLDSEIGRGSTFKVEIPFDPPSALPFRSSVGKKNRSVFPGQPAILCVEDVDLNQLVLKTALEGTGAVLTFADTGKEAIGLLEERGFDLVLLDLRLPDIGGFELARRLREVRPGLEMIAVTAQATETVSDESREAGIRSVVLKPYKRDVLISEIRKVLVSEPGNPYAGLAANLLDEAADELFSASCASRELLVETVEKVRHRLTTTLSLLDLGAVRNVLEKVAGDPDACDEAVETLRAEAQRLGAGGVN